MIRPKSYSTRRLVLRPRRRSDFRLWREFHLRPSQYRSQFERDKFPEERLTREFFYRQLEFFRELERSDHSYFFDAFLKDETALIGSFSVLEIRRDIYQSALLGWSVHGAMWGRGYGTEIVRAGIRAAFKDLGLHSLEAYIETGNNRSLRLAKSVGLIACGRKEKFLTLRGSLRDVRCFYITARKSRNVLR